MDRTDVGVVLASLGGVFSLLQSGLVIGFTSGYCGAVGFVVAALTTVGAIIVYKSRFKLVGSLIILLPSLVGQLTGGIIGMVLIVLTSRQFWPIFNETFAVSSGTLLALIGSILILSSRSARERVRKI